MDSDRTLAQKIILWVLLGLAVVFTAIYIILKCLPGVAFEDTLLKVSAQGAQTIYTGEKYGDAITITTRPEGTGHVVELTIGSSIDHVYRVDYPGGTIIGEYGEMFERITITCDETILFDGGYNPDAFWSGYCDRNGETVAATSVRMYPSGNPWYNYQLHFSEVVDFAAGPETTTRGSWIHYGVALFCSIVCAVAVAFPYTLFELRYHWSVKDPEPTDFYLRMNELGGGVVAVIMLIVYLIGVTKIV